MSNSFKERKDWEKNYTQRVLIGIVVALIAMIGVFNITGTERGRVCLLPEDPFIDTLGLFTAVPPVYKIPVEVKEIKEKKVKLAPPIFSEPIVKIVLNDAPDEILDVEPEAEIDEGPVVIPPPVNRDPVVFAEVMPEFPGGEDAMMKYFSQVTMCEEAKEFDISGRLFAEFVINEKGEVTNVDVIKELFPCLDQGVEQHLRNMPKWSPGKQGGYPVKVIMRVPFKFTTT